MLDWRVWSMLRLVRFFRRPPSTQLLYWRALVTVVRVRLILKLLSFRKVAASRPSSQVNASFEPREIAAAVERVARVVPGATCLTQAAAAHYLLARYGHVSQIRVGVKTEKGRQFTAHAWLLCNDAVVLGGDQRSLSQYSVLTDLDPFASP